MQTLLPERPVYADLERFLGGGASRKVRRGVKLYRDIQDVYTLAAREGKSWRPVIMWHPNNLVLLNLGKPSRRVLRECVWHATGCHVWQNHTASAWYIGCLNGKFHYRDGMIFWNFADRGLYHLASAVPANGYDWLDAVTAAYALHFFHLDADVYRIDRAHLQHIAPY
jgi:hypothetical protein